MALLQSFATEANGNIQIRSEVGKGTEVILNLPEYRGGVRVPKEDTGVELALKMDSDSNYTILLVEDDPDVLAVTSRTLSDVGFTVLEAKAGNEAMHIVKNDKRLFDLMWIDGIIPGVNSADVIDFVSFKYPDTRIVVCSGYVEEELVLTGIETGHLAYVRKTYLTGELLTCIRGQLAASGSLPVKMTSNTGKATFRTVN